MMKRIVLIFPWFLMLVALSPWRTIAGQDDAAYANFAIALSHGHWTPPGLLLAASWPQAILSGALVSILPFAPPLSLLMALSFVVFAFCFWLFRRKNFGMQSPASKINYTYVWLLSFFIFPVVLQHGVSFLSEIFALALLLLYLLSDEHLEKQSSKFVSTALLGLILLPSLITLQRQTTLIVPVVLMAVLVLQALQTKAITSRLIAVFAGVAIAVGCYLLIPKSALQNLFLQETLKFWQLEDGSFAYEGFINRTLQLGVAAGLLLLPLMFTLRWRAKTFAWTLLGQILLITAFIKLPGGPVSIGVLFTDYFPRTLGCILLSFGIWGLAAAVRILRTEGIKNLWAVAAGALVFLSFTAFLNGSDLKYVFPVTIAGLYVLLTRNASKIILEWPRLSAIYFVPVFAVSLFANAYYLDTIQARWTAAAQLEEIGVPAKNISAGYGRDLFVMGQECFDQALAKIGKQPESEHARLLTERISRKTPRVYEDEAVFEYVVKPAKLAGFRLNLKKHVQPGQESEPVSILPYSTWGLLQHELAIFKNSVPRQAWCYQP